MDESESEGISKARLVSVEPINFLVQAIQGTIGTLRILYIQHRLSQENNFEPIAADGENCTLIASDDPLELKIRSETAVWVLWLQVLSNFPPIITAPLLTASSDFIGRKPILIFSTICHLVGALIYLLVAVFDIHLSLTLLAAIVFGLCGDIVGTAAVSTAYIVDSTSSKSRTQKLVLQYFALNVGWGFGQALGGILIQFSNNFTIGFLVPSLLGVVNVVYTICPKVLLETITVSVKVPAKVVVKGIFKNLKGFFTNFKSERKWRVCVLIAIIALNILVKEGLYEVIVIFGLGRPFCWTPNIVGIYSAAVAVFPAAIAAVITKPLVRCFSEYWLIHFAFLSFIAQVLTTAFAKNTIQLAVLGTALGFLRTAQDPICNDLIAKMVKRSENGRTFAMLSLVSNISTTCSSFWVGGLFSYTVKTETPEITFYVAAAILLIAMLLNGTVQAFQPRSIRNASENNQTDQRPQNCSHPISDTTAVNTICTTI